ncbi:MAG: hydrolase [Proteobacteria bacterium]|nr:hydrolase [Pseudomonadota bacterium]
MLIGLACALTLAACGPPDSAGEGVASTLRQVDTGGFERAEAPWAFRFPADHGPHPDFRDEWWYLTGNLDGPVSQRFGFQITFFRHGLKRGMPQRASAWGGNEVYMAHFAVTDAAQRRFTSLQRISRTGPGLAGTRAEPFKVWVENWFLEARLSGGFPWQFRAEQEGVALDLKLTPLKPVILHGERGLARKGPDAGNASYYYSIPRLAAEGTLRLDGSETSVKGLAWLDREWSTQMLADYQAGWDWFSLQLADGTDIMFIRIRRRDGTEEPASSGSLIRADGSMSPLARDDVSIEVLATWDSPAGASYPARWRLTLRKSGRTLEIRPVLADQELRQEARYWEGAVDVFEVGTGSPAGRGYVELTGYAPDK